MFNRRISTVKGLGGFNIDDKVMLHGLTAAPSLNGLTGVILCFGPDRAQVKLDAPPQDSLDKVLAKPCNLKFLGEPAGAGPKTAQSSTDEPARKKPAAAVPVITVSADGEEDPDKYVPNTYMKIKKKFIQQALEQDKSLVTTLDGSTL